MANPLTAAWDYLRGADLKALTPPSPAAAPPAPEVKSLVFTGDSIPFRVGSYPDAGGDYWNPLLAPTAGASASTLNSAVFSCLKLLAQSFQEAPLRVFRVQVDGTEAWLDDDPLTALLADPHPVLSQSELAFWLVFTLHVTGNTYLRKIRNRAGQVVQLWPISPATMTPETTEDDRQRGVFISHYVHDDGKGKREELAPEDVVHFRLGVDDADHRLGLSPLMRLLREISSDEEATRFTDALLKNSALSSLAVTVPPGPVLTEEQAEQIRDRLREDYGGANRGRLAVLGNGATLQQIGFSPQQLDLKAAHTLPETRICAVLGVPPMLVGLNAGLEHTIYNNMEQAEEHFFEMTVNPLWRLLAAILTKQLLRPDFDADPKVRLKFDTVRRTGPAGGHERGLRPHLRGRGEGLDDQGRGPGGGGPRSVAGRPGRGPRPPGAAEAAGGDQRAARQRVDVRGAKTAPPRTGRRRPWSRRRPCRPSTPSRPCRTCSPRCPRPWCRPTSRRTSGSSTSGWCRPSEGGVRCRPVHEKQPHFMGHEQDRAAREEDEAGDELLPPAQNSPAGPRAGTRSGRSGRWSTSSPGPSSPSCGTSSCGVFGGGSVDVSDVYDRLEEQRRLARILMPRFLRLLQAWHEMVASVFQLSPEEFRLDDPATRKQLAHAAERVVLIDQSTRAALREVLREGQQRGYSKP